MFAVILREWSSRPALEVTVVVVVVAARCCVQADCCYETDPAVNTGHFLDE